jgi:ligand-binding sensor domain-containing protein/signal transduction histidine kinase
MISLQRMLAMLAMATLPAYAHAQRKDFSPTSMLSQGFVYKWTGENGLISNNITSAIQSNDGFIWITTYNGIMRFDGKRITVFDKSTIPFLETEAFYRGYEDKQGTLWFASQGSGIVVYKNKKFESVTSSDSIPIPKSVRSLLIDDNVVWIGTNNEGLYKLEATGALTHIHHPKLDKTNVLDLVKDQRGILWIATDGNGLLAYNGQYMAEYTEAEGLLSNGINALAVSQRGELFIGTTEGLNVLQNNKIRALDFLRDVPINDLTIDAENRKWIATENGLARISADNTFEEFANSKNGFPYTRLNTVCKDAEGSVWISTGRDGLLQVRETGIMNIGENLKLSSDRINVVVEGRDRAFYIGSDASTVDVYKNGELKPIPLTTDLNGAAIRDICEDEKGVLWIASYKGVLRKEGTRERLLAKELGAVDIRRILRDKEGNLWIGSRSGGVMQYSTRRNQVLKTYSKDSGLSSNYILSIEEDNVGNIYVGTHSGGLTIIRPNGTTQTYHLSADDAGVLIFNIHIEAPDKVWLVSNIGLYLFNGSTFKKINLTASTKGETHFDWLEDDARNVWITSNLGVLRITRSQLNDYLAGKTTSVTAKILDHQDGMLNKECTGATRSLKSSSGKLWIPTIGGVSIFYPEKIVNNLTLPNTYVTELVTDYGTFVSDTVVVEPGNLRYTFYYTALSYLAPAKLKFKYQLTTVDDTWVEGGNKREAEYTNLSPGTYTFRVLASNNDGYWATESAVKTVIVLPYFYQTAWFIATCIVLAIALLYGAYRWRVYVVEKRNRELRKLNSELDRFVYSASHDLRAPLSSILGLITVARMDTQSNKLEYLDMIEKSIHKLDGFIHDIIDFSRNSRTELQAEEIYFEPLIHELIDELKYMDEKGAIQKYISVHGNASFYTDRKRLAIIMRNLISNAYKYHNPRVTNNFIKIHVEYNHQRAVVSLTDNGIGIASEHLPNIFKMFYRGSETNKGSGLGLYIVKEATEKLGGTITVTSALEKGTEFKLVLPSLKA